MDNVNPFPMIRDPQIKEAIDAIVLEAAQKRAALIESFVIAYLDKTGLHITDVELVERNEGMKVVCYFRKKGSSD